MVVVPLYDTLGPDAIRFIINTGETDRQTDRERDTHTVASLFKHTPASKAELFYWLTRGAPFSSSSLLPVLFPLLLLLLPLLCAGVFSADISTVICDKVDKAKVLLDNVERQETPGLQRIILMDAVQTHLVERGQHCGVHVQAMQEVEVEWWERLPG